MKKISYLMLLFPMILSFILLSCGVGEVSDDVVISSVQYLTDKKKNDESWIRDLCRYKYLGKNLKTTKVVILRKEKPEKDDNNGNESFYRQRVLVNINGTVDAYQNSLLYIIKKENYLGNIPIEFTGLLEFRYYKSGDHWAPCYDLTIWN